MRREHLLKTWPTPFNAVLSGAKLHEIRVDDRDFGVGDILILREFEPNGGSGNGRFTDRWLVAKVAYKSEGGTWGLPSNLCVMSLRLLRSGDGYGGWSLP